MRVKDLFYTIIISTITSLFMIGILIGAGILQTRQPPTSYQIKQTISNMLVGTFDVPSGSYLAQEELRIRNVTDKASLRVLHFYLEFNETAVLPRYVLLVDQESKKTIIEKKPESHLGTLTIDTSLKVDKPYYVHIFIEGENSFIFKYNATIIQDIRL